MAPAFSLLEVVLAVSVMFSVLAITSLGVRAVSATDLKVTTERAANQLADEVFHQIELEWNDPERQDSLFDALAFPSENPESETDPFLFFANVELEIFSLDEVHSTADLVFRLEVSSSQVNSSLGHLELTISFPAHAPKEAQVSHHFKQLIHRQ